MGGSNSATCAHLTQPRCNQNGNDEGSTQETRTDSLNATGRKLKLGLPPPSGNTQDLKMKRASTTGQRASYASRNRVPMLGGVGRSLAIMKEGQKVNPVRRELAGPRHESHACERAPPSVMGKFFKPIYDWALKTL
ncbi:hypothetical protein VNO77_19911 [Canavalia gladiata]|uniref:Uncharacterized protein n=1 Tax=Canavalia gladiata TaxID=3824 RepID=A0AAN9LND7_CANGL